MLSQTGDVHIVVHSTQGWVDLGTTQQQGAPSTAQRSIILLLHLLTASTRSYDRCKLWWQRTHAKTIQTQQPAPLLHNHQTSAQAHTLLPVCNCSHVRVTVQHSNHGLADGGNDTVSGIHLLCTQEAPTGKSFSDTVGVHQHQLLPHSGIPESLQTDYKRATTAL